MSLERVSLFIPTNTDRNEVQTCLNCNMEVSEIGERGCFLGMDGFIMRDATGGVRV